MSTSGRAEQSRPEQQEHTMITSHKSLMIIKPPSLAEVSSGGPGEQGNHRCTSVAGHVAFSQQRMMIEFGCCQLLSNS